MPLGALVELVVQPIAEFVIQVAGYITARIIVPVFTFGLMRVEPGSKGEFVKPGLGRIRRLPNGRRIIEAELASLIGILFWILVGISVYLLR